MDRLKNIAFGFVGAGLCFALILAYREWRQYQLVKSAVADVLCLTPPALQQKYAVKCEAVKPPAPTNATPGAPTQ